MRHKNLTLELSSIDSRDDAYRITTGTKIDDLLLSIGNVGLLNPPLLRKNNSGYTVVCGFRRIEACRSLGWDRVEAKILVPETTDLDCAKFAVTDNALQRPLNLIEKSRSINLISGLVKDDSLLAKELSALGLPENPSIIKKLKKICHLKQPVQNAVLSNTISLSMALELGRLAPVAGNRFVTLFETLKLSLNKQREVLTLIQEIAFREDISSLEILDEKSFGDIIHHPDFDRSQKAQMVRLYLKKRRFPTITAAEKAFDRMVKALNLGHPIKLIPPKNFEGSSYTLSMNFKNLAELKHCRAAFDEVIGNPDLEKILD